MTPEPTDDAEPVLTASQQDPTEQENAGAGPDHVDPPAGVGSGEMDLDDVPDAPAGPAATPADPDQPLNPG